MGGVGREGVGKGEVGGGEKRWEGMGGVVWDGKGEVRWDGERWEGMERGWEGEGMER